MQSLILAILMALPVVTSKPVTVPAAQPPQPLVASSDNQALSGRAAPQYVIRIRLCEVAEGGKTKVLACPVVATVEGRPARIQIGGEIPAPANSGVGGVPFGVSFECTVWRNDQDDAFLGATLVVDRAETSDEDRAVVVGQRLRVVQKITFGQPRTMSLTKSELAIYQLELVVEQVPPLPQ